MARLKVKVRFADKFNPARLFEVGQVVEFDDAERVADIVSRGLAECVEAPPIKAAERSPDMDATDEVISKRKQLSLRNRKGARENPNSNP